MSIPLRKTTHQIVFQITRGSPWQQQSFIQSSTADANPPSLAPTEVAGSSSESSVRRSMIERLFYRLGRICGTFPVRVVCISVLLTLLVRCVRAIECCIFLFG